MLENDISHTLLFTKLTTTKHYMNHPTTTLYISIQYSSLYIQYTTLLFTKLTTTKQYMNHHNTALHFNNTVYSTVHYTYHKMPHFSLQHWSIKLTSKLHTLHLNITQFTIHFPTVRVQSVHIRTRTAVHYTTYLRVNRNKTCIISTEWNTGPYMYTYSIVQYYSAPKKLTLRN